MGLIRRTFAYLDESLFKKLYITFVRPHIEYAQSVWSPHLLKYIKQLENVQIRATAQVDGLKNMEYSERLKKLDLPTLVYRRKRGDMIEVWKHFNVYDPETLSPNFKRNVRNIRSHHHSQQLTLNRPRDGKRGVQANSFYFRAAEEWNGLSEAVVQAEEINKFKNELDESWNHHPLKFTMEEIDERFSEAD